MKIWRATQLLSRSMYCSFQSSFKFKDPYSVQLVPAGIGFLLNICNGGWPL